METRTVSYMVPSPISTSNPISDYVIDSLSEVEDPLFDGDGKEMRYFDKNGREMRYENEDFNYNGTL